MTNAEKLAKQMLNNLDDFARILLDGICLIHGYCDDCPLRGVSCGDEKAIERWLESEAEEYDNI